MTKTKQEVMALSKDQIEMLKTRLIDEQNRLIFKGILETEEFVVADDDIKDEVDHANSDALNAQRLRFRNREVLYEKKLRQALERIEKNEYGCCEECESPIGFTRLMARPTAEKCISCKEDSERDESNNFIQRKSKSYGNAISYVKSL